MESVSVHKQAERESRAPKPRVQTKPIEGNLSAQLLQLQQQAGNRAVRRLVASRARKAGGVQRAVTKRGIGKNFSQAILIKDQNELNTEVRAVCGRAAFAEPRKFPDYDLIKPELTDAAIAQHTPGALDDGPPRPVQAVAEDVFARVRESYFKRRLAKEGSTVLPGLKVAVPIATAGTRAVPSTKLPASVVTVSAPYIDFRAVVSVDGKPETLHGWHVGLTQTVLHVDREFELRMVDANGHTWIADVTNKLGAPANDRNEGSTPPWYNEHSALDGGAANYEVTLTDKPGEDLDFTKGDFAGGSATGVQLKGIDRFCTWVILWHPTKRPLFLGGWRWHVDYGGESGPRTEVSGFVPRTGTAAPPAEAVLDGPRGGALLKSTAVTTRRRIPSGGEASQKFDVAPTKRAPASKTLTQAFKDLETALEAKDKAAKDKAAVTERETKKKAVMTERKHMIAAWRDLQPKLRPQHRAAFLRLLYASKPRG